MVFNVGLVAQWLRTLACSCWCISVHPSREWCGTVLQAADTTSGNGIQFQDLAGALMIIFKAHFFFFCQWQARKLARDFQWERYQDKQLGLSEKNCFWLCGFSRWDNQKRHLGGRQSQTLKEEAKTYFCREWCWCFERAVYRLCWTEFWQSSRLVWLYLQSCHILFNGVVDLFADRLAATSVRRRVGSGLAETEQDQLFSFAMEVTHKNRYHDNGSVKLDFLCKWPGSSVCVEYA